MDNSSSIPSSTIQQQQRMVITTSGGSVTSSGTQQYNSELLLEKENDIPFGQEVAGARNLFNNGENTEEHVHCTVQLRTDDEILIDEVSQQQESNQYHREEYPNFTNYTKTTGSLTTRYHPLQERKRVCHSACDMTPRNKIVPRKVYRNEPKYKVVVTTRQHHPTTTKGSRSNGFVLSARSRSSSFHPISPYRPFIPRSAPITELTDRISTTVSNRPPLENHFPVCHSSSRRKQDSTDHYYETNVDNRFNRMDLNSMDGHNILSSTIVSNKICDGTTNNECNSDTDHVMLDQYTTSNNSNMIKQEKNNDTSYTPNNDKSGSDHATTTSSPNCDGTPSNFSINDGNVASSISNTDNDDPIPIHVQQQRTQCCMNPIAKIFLTTIPTNSVHSNRHCHNLPLDTSDDTAAPADQNHPDSLFVQWSNPTNGSNMLQSRPNETHENSSSCCCSDDCNDYTFSNHDNMKTPPVNTVTLQRQSSCTSALSCGSDHHHRSSFEKSSSFHLSTTPQTLSPTPPIIVGDLKGHLSPLGNVRNDANQATIFRPYPIRPNQS